MQTTITVDDTLIAEALEVSGLKTHEEAVEFALRELIRKRRQPSIEDLWGIGWDGDLEQMRLDKREPEA
jgi:Arc/MetJ family transcription regulator